MGSYVRTLGMHMIFPRGALVTKIEHFGYDLWIAKVWSCEPTDTRVAYDGAKVTTPSNHPSMDMK